MKMLALTRYSRLGASSRLRTMQYVPALQARGFDVAICPFFDDAYLHSVYSGTRSRSRLSWYFTNRTIKMLKKEQPDVIWVEKEAFPWAPWVLEKHFYPPSVPVVADYDDAVFHRYDLHSRAVVRRILGQKIDNVMSKATLVTAGNRYIAERARAAGASWVEIVPTVVDGHAYSVGRIPDPDGCSRVGWIGTPQSWQELAQPIARTLEHVLAQRDAIFRAVGAGLVAERIGSLEVLPWSEAEEVALIKTMDVGVMPMPDSPWTRGKCGYKLIQYMACGVPVIAAPIGVNKDIVEHGVTGFLASTEQEWREACNTLLLDRNLRQRMGAAGRRIFEERFELASWGKRLSELLTRVVAQSK